MLVQLVCNTLILELFRVLRKFSRLISPMINHLHPFVRHALLLELRLWSLSTGLEVCFQISLVSFLIKGPLCLAWLHLSVVKTKVGFLSDCRSTLLLPLLSTMLITQINTLLLISPLVDLLLISTIMLEFRREQLYLLHLLFDQVTQNADGVFDALKTRGFANKRSSEAAIIR